MAARTVSVLLAASTLMLCTIAVSTRGGAGDMVDMTGVEPWDTCGECHGLDGAGNHIKFPRLAGQKQSYIVNEILDFRAGRRRNDDGQMQQTAQELTTADIPRVAQWFASQTPPWPKLTIEEEPDLDRARRLAISGIAGAAPCLSCHSAASLRMLDKPFDAPRIAGQRDFYIAKELTDFRAGRRSNDPERMMRKIAQRLTDSEIVSLAVFLSQNPDLHEMVIP
jgi:cytochrome c553